jgi:hypothetical protein
MSLGSYTWMVILQDGTAVSQYNDAGAEVSVDTVRHLPVRQLHLVPHETAGCAPIVLEIQAGEDWAKKWVRTFALNLDTGEQVEEPTVDAISLNGVNIFIYADGSIRITTNKEP